MKDKPYRGVFRKTDGSLVGLDFWASTRPLALSHAMQLSSDVTVHREVGPLALVKVTRLASVEDMDPGVFYDLR